MKVDRPRVPVARERKEPRHGHGALTGAAAAEARRARSPFGLLATRDAEGSYAFVYSASGKPFSVDLGKLSGKEIRGSWYDPRNGTSRAIGTFQREGVREFRPPSQGKGHDWVLVLDDADRGYDAPGGRAGDSRS